MPGRGGHSGVPRGLPASAAARGEGNDRGPPGCRGRPKICRASWGVMDKVPSGALPAPRPGCVLWSCCPGGWGAKGESRSSREQCQVNSPKSTLVVALRPPPYTHTSPPGQPLPSLSRRAAWRGQPGACCGAGPGGQPAAARGGADSSPRGRGTWKDTFPSLGPPGPGWVTSPRSCKGGGFSTRSPGPATPPPSGVPRATQGAGRGSRPARTYWPPGSL